MESKTLKEMTICCFGDSTTWGDDGNGGGGNDMSWTVHLGALLGGATVENYGVKGSRIAVKSDRNDSFVERLDAVDDRADIYVVFGGVNDFSRNVPLGEPGSTDVHEFYGALDYLIRTISKRTPRSKLVFMTPCKTSGKCEKDIPASTEANHLGLTQEVYVRAILDVCERYSVPVIDLYSQSGISPFLPEHRALYMPDGLHYSPAGYERLAHRIAAGLFAVCR
ncbi:SGNH/GDSL hydrolase family protein [Collinsella tanakaei]|uniref:SGNH/GDSL hydrolase family protein n=1 Tax=Collinsella tanakaei TaxID=626935 RepID=UPI002F94CA38